MVFFRKLIISNNNLFKFRLTSSIFCKDFGAIQQSHARHSSYILCKKPEINDVNRYTINYVPNRSKTNKRKKRREGEQEADSDDDEDDDVSEFRDSGDGSDKNIIQFRVTSLRVDTILKRALNIARNKIEQKFYDSQLRVNGKKIPKKSVSVQEGDEIDVIKGPSPLNPENLLVSRVEILSTTPRLESINVVAKRYKSFTIENYPGENAYKGT